MDHAANHATSTLLALFIVFVAALIGAEIAQRLKMPAVVGEIAAGCGVVVMLRHSYTNYHDLLDRLRDKSGRSAAYRILRRRVNQTVCTAVRIDYGDGSKWNDIEEAWVTEAMRER
jgi:hypothetical protein